MIPDSFGVNRERITLPQSVVARGQHETDRAPVLGLVSLGLAAGGVALLVVGARPDGHTLLVRPSLAPIVLAFGLVLLLVAGLFLVRALAAVQVAVRRAGAWPDPALRDHPWDPRRSRPPRWRALGQHLVMLVTLGLFVAPFHWLAWDEGSWVAGLPVAVFDLILGYNVYLAVLLLLRAARFGDSAVEFPRFPLRPGEEATLRWIVPEGLTELTRGRWILRCVEEVLTSNGGQRGQGAMITQTQVLALTVGTDRPQSLQPGDVVTLNYLLPADAPSTSLSQAPVVFWELFVHIERPGVDFEAAYLVPIYRPG